MSRTNAMPHANPRCTDSSMDDVLGCPTSPIQGCDKPLNATAPFFARHWALLYQRTHARHSGHMQSHDPSAMHGSHARCAGLSFGHNGFGRSLCQGSSRTHSHPTAWSEPATQQIFSRPMATIAVAFAEQRLGQSLNPKTHVQIARPSPNPFHLMNHIQRVSHIWSLAQIAELAQQLLVSPKTNHFISPTAVDKTHLPRPNFASKVTATTNKQHPKPKGC